jgi:peptidyl-prolyl cis-trans isomerase A (cyclophilin A)
LFAVSVANPVADFTLTSANKSNTIPLGGVFATTNLNNVSGSVVRMPVVFGVGANAVNSAIVLELYDQATPLTVQNFLNYVNGGSYTNTIVHRTTTVGKDGIGVIQGGGFTYNPTSGQFGNVTTVTPVVNEFASSPRDSLGRVNVRGTISVARTSAINSGTSQFFINTTDNTALDNAAQGNQYCVFGKVIGGLSVADQINALPTYNGSSLNSAFTALPLADYNTSNQLAPANVVRFTGASVVPANQVKSYFAYSVSSSSSLVTATLDANNNLVVSTATAAKPGQSTITITAMDLTGAAVTETVKVTVGVPILAISYGRTAVSTKSNAPALDLGAAFVGETATRTLTLKNTGNITLNVGNIALPAGVSIVGNAPTSIEPGATANLVLGLDTTSAAVRSGVVSITVPNSPTSTFPVSAFVSDGVVLSGKPAPGAVSSVTYVDADGSRATFSLKGNGTARLEFTGTGLSLSVVKRVATVTAATGGVGVSTVAFASGDATTALSAAVSRGTVNVGSISSGTGIKSLALKGVVVTDGVSIGGGVNDIALAGLDSGTVSVAGSLKTLVLGDVAGSTVSVTGAVTTATAGMVLGSRWTVGGASTGLTAKSVTGSTLAYTGGLGSLTVGGAVAGSSVTAAGTVKKVSAASLTDSTLTASGLTSVTLTAKTPDAFAGSLVSATQVGSLVVGGLSVNGATATVRAGSIQKLSGRAVPGKAFSIVKITSSQDDVAGQLTAAGVPAGRLVVNIVS